MYLASCGLVTPVGLSFPAAAAAMRAGIAAFAELPYHDGLGKPVIGAEVPDIAAGLRGIDRLVDLVVPAIRECLDGAGIADVAEVPVLLNVPERDSQSDVVDSMLSIVRSEFGGRLHPRSRLLRDGRTGAASALALGRDLLEREAECCVVAGVDSLIDARRLAALIEHDRLKTALNPDGLIPGEAAGAVLLTRSPQSLQEPGAEVTGIGFGVEEVKPESDEPMLGIGLANALRGALGQAGIDIADAACRLSDLTGEKYFFVEANYAMSRVLRRRKPEFPLWHPMDSIGDTGAAAGFCLLAIAKAALAKRYAPGPVLLLQMSAESGRRAAVVVRSVG